MGLREWWRSKFPKPQLVTGETASGADAAPSPILRPPEFEPHVAEMASGGSRSPRVRKAGSELGESLPQPDRVFARGVLEDIEAEADAHDMLATDRHAPPSLAASEKNVARGLRLAAGIVKERAAGAIIVFLLATLAFAGTSLSSGSYAMNLGNGPVEFIACAAMWPFPASIMVDDVTYVLDEDGKYRNGPVSFEFTSPGLVEKVRVVPPPMSGPPVIVDGSYGSN